MAAPPVWGPQSYTIGAGMARVTVAAAFIKANMPRSWGWSLSDDDAYTDRPVLAWLDLAGN
jgi:thiosulfate dehydrogenase